ncbi:hypothetical protein HPP92_006206 [Vanilla planifolia]|uniref:DUF7798 domain-containing protein n=1 Tax=Vanilla planifolia TaxID=51239 RepID=A0A835S117_VANPL|nr:hypothetical protein HPP92_006206 [Vanilla planifolia]
MAEETGNVSKGEGDNSRGDGGGGGDGADGRGGWGGWGFPSFSVLSDLQKVASAAAQEISKNAAAVAKSITDIDVEEEDMKSDASGDKEGKESESENEDDKSQLRKSALDKLERASEDSLLGQGLKAIDSSVESLAFGAWHALGNALKGGSNLVQKLEHSAVSLAGSINHSELPAKATSLAPSLLEASKSFTSRGIQVLERVGKETIERLIAETGLEVEKSPKKADQHVDEEPFEEITFDRCFYIYGGPDHLEEKSKLASEQKSFYDGKLKQIKQILSLGSSFEENEIDLDKGKNVETSNDVNDVEMKSLRDSSVSKAADMAAGFTTAIVGLATSDAIQKTMSRLETVHSEGVHRVSEFCCFGLSHVLMLGKSVITNANNSKATETGDGNATIDWPEDSVLKAKIIRSKAQSMCGDVEFISNSFLTGVSDIIEAYQASIRSASSDALQQHNSVQEKANIISNLLKADRTTAMEKIQDALQFLPYVVLSTSL